MYDCIVFFHINLSFVHPALTMLVHDKIAIQSGFVRNEDSRGEERCSSARLLNLHIAIYSTTHGHPSDHDSIVPPPWKEHASSWHSARATTKVYRREQRAEHWSQVRVREFWTSYRLLVSANRGERATIISRQSPRKSSQRTGTTPPLCANFSYGQKALGLATNKRSYGRYQARALHARVLTRANSHACAFSFVWLRTHIWLLDDLDSSANVAYAREGFLK